MCPGTSRSAWMISTQFSTDNKQIVTLSDSIQVHTHAHVCVSISSLFTLVLHVRITCKC